MSHLAYERWDEVRREVKWSVSERVFTCWLNTDVSLLRCQNMVISGGCLLCIHLRQLEKQSVQSVEIHKKSIQRIIRIV